MSLFIGVLLISRHLYYNNFIIYLALFSLTWECVERSVVTGSIYCTFQWLPRGGGLNPPPPEIPKISVESSIAWARRTSVSISFCSSLCSHTVVIYKIKVSFNTNCLAVTYLVSEFKPIPNIPKVWQSRTRLQIEQKMFSFPIAISWLV